VATDPLIRSILDEIDPAPPKARATSTPPEISSILDELEAADTAQPGEDLRRAGALPTAAVDPDRLHSEEPQGFLGDLWDSLTRGTGTMVTAIGGAIERHGQQLALPELLLEPTDPAQAEALARARELYSVGTPGVALPVVAAAAEPQYRRLVDEPVARPMIEAGRRLQQTGSMVAEQLPRPAYAQDFWAGFREGDPAKAAKTMAVAATESLPNLIAILGASSVPGAGPVLGVTTAYELEAGGAYQEAKESGATEEEAQQIAGWVGLGNAALEYLPAGRLLRMMRGGTEPAKRAVFRELLKQAASEGGTETLQEANQVLTQALILNQDLTFEEFAARVGEAGLTGLLVGGGTAAPAQAVGYFAEKREAAKPVETGTVLPFPSASVPNPEPMETDAGVVSESVGAQEPPYTGPERRKDVSTRKRVDEMTPEEMRVALLTDRLTGLGNDRALAESTYPVHAALDLNGVKWVNDTFGHEMGDQLLHMVGRAIAEATDGGFRKSGDEFFIGGADESEVRDVLEQVQETLASSPIEGTSKDGTVYRFSPTFGFGIGSTPQQADDILVEEKRRAREEGRRAGRGEQPPGVELLTPPPPAVEPASEASTGLGSAALTADPDRLWELSGEDLNRFLTDTEGEGSTRAREIAGQILAHDEAVEGLANELQAVPGPSFIQRRLHIGFANAARLHDRLKARGWEPPQATPEAIQLESLSQDPELVARMSPDDLRRFLNDSPGQDLLATARARAEDVLRSDERVQGLAEELGRMPTAGDVQRALAGTSYSEAQSLLERLAATGWTPPPAPEVPPHDGPQQEQAPEAAGTDRIEQPPAAILPFKKGPRAATGQPAATVPEEGLGEEHRRSPSLVLADRLAARIEEGAFPTARDLQTEADAAYGGTQAQGTYSQKDASDALELAVNLLVVRNPGRFGANVDAATAIQRSEDLGGIISRLPTQTRRTQETISHQQFSTPPPLGFLVNWTANIGPNDVVAEPSAGTGSLAAIATASGARQVIVNELAPRRAELLQHPEFGFRVFTENAEQLDNILPDDVRPTVVVMNPPFSQTAGRLGDRRVLTVGANHVEQALRRVEPGGRVVAVVGGGREGQKGGMRSTSATYRRWFERIGQNYNIRANIGIPGSVYRKYGTTFPTRVLVIDKTGPTPKGGTLETDVKTLDEAFNLLETVRERNIPVPEPPGPGPEQPDGRREQPLEPRGPAEGAEPSHVPPAGAASRESGRGSLPRSTEPTPRLSRPDDAVDVEPRPGGSGDGVVEPAAVVGDQGRARQDAGAPEGTSDAGVSPARLRPRGEPRRERGARGGDAGVDRGGASESREPGDRSVPAARELDRAPEPPGGDVPAVAPAAAASEAKTGTDSARAKIEAAAPERAKGEISDALFEPYTPQRLKIPGARPHPSALVEPAVMAAIPPPVPTYSPAFSRPFIEKEDGLSLPQLESVVYAGQAHQRFLPNGMRQGFALGDGTGAGKGRQVAGVILDNWHQGRKRAVWISEKRTLIEDARRDWRDLGGKDEDFIELPALPLGESISQKEGILFATYDTLKAISKRGAGSRLDQILSWLGPDFDGVVVYDEAHNMGNATDEGEEGGSRGVFGRKKASQKAVAGTTLQDRLPKARVMYVSATAATEVSNLAYMSRLGLWGEGTAFGDRDDFVNRIGAGGLAALELVARDLKARGLYLARSLAFSDGTREGTVTYEPLLHKLTAEQRLIYGTVAEAWQTVLRNIDRALRLTAADDRGRVDGRAKARAMSQFWSAHQRFFSQLLTSLQMPSVFQQIDEDLKAGRSVVLQLVNTYEAAQERGAARAEASGLDLDDLDVSPAEMLMGYVDAAFPTEQMEAVKEDGVTKMVPVVDSHGRPVKNREAERLKQELLEKLGSIRTPAGPLDQLLDQYGPEMVAEVTGRKRRLVTGKDGKKAFEARGTRANLAESEAFNNGPKRILIFSDAGGTGRSYNASKKYKNRQRRAHYLLQMGWRADKAVQGFGRTHRTNQDSAPIYRLVSTDVPGHKRFVSTIARRLDQLGALTKGERRSGGGGVISETDNLENPLAGHALFLLLRDITLDQVEGIPRDQFEEQTGIKLEGTQTKTVPVPQFLNRLLALDLDFQATVFGEFEQRFRDVVESAAANGELDRGAEVLRADSVTVEESTTVFTDAQTGIETKYVKLKVGEKAPKLPYSKIQDRLGPGRPLLWIMRNAKSGRLYAVADAKPRTDKKGNLVEQFRTVNERGAFAFIDKDRATKDNWERVLPEEAEELWSQALDELPPYEYHTRHLFTGTLLPIWDRLVGSPQVIRVQTDDGERLLGRVMLGPEAQATLEALGVGLKETFGPEVLERVLKGEGEARLANGWTIRRRKVQGEWRLELLGGYGGLLPFREELLRHGVFTEMESYQTRYFIPVGEKGKKVFEAITKTREVVAFREYSERDSGMASVKHAVRADPRPPELRLPLRRGPHATQPADPDLQTVPWWEDESETAGGRKLVAAIRKDVKGEKVGIRTIVDFLGAEVGTELRVGKEQTERKRPAHYEEDPHLIRSRTGNSMTYLAHELGHGISRVIRAQGGPAAYNRIRKGLRGITTMPGSFASRKTSEEGLAEWVRRFVQEPESIDGLDVTAQITGYLGREHQNLLATLRDAARAYGAHMERDVGARFRSHSRARPAKAPLRQRKAAAVDRLLFTVFSRRRGIHRLENQLWEAFVEEGIRRRTVLAPTLARIAAAWGMGTREVRDAQAQARAFRRSIRDTPADIERAYQQTIHVLEGVNQAIYGTNPAAPGIWVSDKDGNKKQFYKLSVSDIVAKVGEENWSDFENYGQMRAVISSVEERGHVFPGKSSGDTLAELKQKVAEIEKGHPEWKDRFREIEGYSRALLKVSVEGELISREEAARMRTAYGDYWPLFREVERGHEVFGLGGSAAEEIDPGFRRRRGGEQPIIPILEALHRQTSRVLTAYYWNRALLAPVRLADRIAETDAPLMVQATAARVATRLHPELEAKMRVASVYPYEAERMVADWRNLTALKAATGEEKTLEELISMSEDEFEQIVGFPKLSASDVDIWWRPGDIFRRRSPKDTGVNVMVARENGERVFYQIEDPILFDMYTKSRNPGEFFKWFERVLVPVTAPWKRIVTGNIAFTMSNVARDVSTAMFFGTDPESLMPGLYALQGLIGRLSGRRVFASQAELLSRAVERVSSPIHARRVKRFQEAFPRRLQEMTANDWLRALQALGRNRWDRLKEVAGEGIVLDRWADMSSFERLAAMPGIGMSALLKPVDLALWATGQRFVAEVTEVLSREGAFRQAKRRGRSDEAAQIAYDMTTGNFGETPGSGDLAAIYRTAGFLNPATQITYEMMRRLSDPDPQVRAAAWGKIAWAGLVAAVGWAINQLLTPDERLKELAERDEEERLSYMPLFGILRIPFDYGLIGAVQAWTWSLLDEHVARFKTPKAQKSGARLLLKRAMDLPGHPMAFMQPQVTSFLESEANYDWYRMRPLEPAWMELAYPEEPWKRAYPDTPEFYVEASRLSRLGPLKIQHLVRSGLSYQLDEAIRLVDRVGKGGRVAEEPADLPFIGRRFVRRPRGWRSASVETLTHLDDRYRALRVKVDDLEGSSGTNAKELRALHKRLDALESAHSAFLDLRRLSQAARAERKAGRLNVAREKEEQMVREAASALALIDPAVLEEEGFR
jgi:GGDEF domain-containing protein/predicted RNA methylase